MRKPTETVSIDDGLRNLVSGMGTLRDKAASTEYTMPVHNPLQLNAMYRSSYLAKKIVDLPAKDSMREWRDWQAKGTDISKIEILEKQLGLKPKLILAAKRGRLLGGCAVLIGTGEADLSKRLDPSKAKRGALKYLTVLSRDQLTATELETDPREPNFEKPKSYTLQTVSATLEIHPSRLVIFGGDEILDSTHSVGYDGWSDSVLTSCESAIRDVDATAANIASLVFEAKVDVLRIPNFMKNLKNEGQSYEKLITDRASLAALAKGINGMLLLDADEEYDQKKMSFATLPDVIQKFMILTSAAAGIPMTLLFGVSATGLNATGESDVRAYYDRIKAIQTLELEPAMSVLDEMLIRSALGDRPDDVFYNWSPLWQPTTKERAETGKIIVETFEKMHTMEAAPIEVISKSLVNALTESGVAPGLEADMRAHYEGDDSEVGDPDPLLADAVPKTLYIRRQVTNAAEIIKWAKAQGFKDTLEADDLHVTIAYSRTPVDWFAVGDSWSSELKISAGGARMVEQFGEARVLMFAGSELSWRHEEIKRAGATWDHPEYQPHITISYDPNSPDIADIEPYQGEIMLGPEIFEEVNDKWMEE